MNVEKLSYMYSFDSPRSYMKILSSFTTLLVYCIVRHLLYLRKKMNKDGVRIKLIIIHTCYMKRIAYWNLVTATHSPQQQYIHQLLREWQEEKAKKLPVKTFIHIDHLLEWRWENACNYNRQEYKDALSSYVCISLTMMLMEF